MSFRSHEIIPERPNNLSWITFIGFCVVTPISIYAGAETARYLVSFVEDNDIWHYEPDDD